MIRHAVEGDLSAIVRLNSMVWDLHSSNLPAIFKPPNEERDQRALLADLLGNPRGSMLVAEEAQHVVGYLYATEITHGGTWIWQPKHCLMIEHLAVEPTFCRRGIGTALMEECFSVAEARGIRHVDLICWSFNDPARRFFEKHGFIPVQTQLRKTLS